MGLGMRLWINSLVPRPEEEEENGSGNEENGSWNEAMNQCTHQ